MYNAKFFVSCLGIGLTCGCNRAVSLRCLISIIFFCFTANSLVDRNENGLVWYGFEKSSSVRVRIRIRVRW